MIVLDLETTGLDPIKNSILEIGAIDFLNPANQFQGKCKVWEGASIDPLALEVNGFSFNDKSYGLRIEQIDLLEDFITWSERIEDRTIAGHNVDFDISFLNESAKRCEIELTFGKRKVDQHSLVYAHMLYRKVIPPLKNGISSISGDIIMDYVGIPREPRPHLAINGARYEAEALFRIIFGKSLLDEFSNYPIPDYLIPFQKK